jgi:predicted patatin/cPLA2 family phospholipase
VSRAVVRLVLEGGGARAAYSAGICLALQQARLHCEVVVGSSSGSVNAAFYAAGAMEVLCEHWPEVAADRQVISWRRQLTPFGGPGLDLDQLVDGIFLGRGWLDPVAATSGHPVLLITATDVMTCSGRVARPNAETLGPWLKASLALPAAYNRVVRIDDRAFIDGGVAIPVPFDIPELDPFPGKTIVILTRKVSTQKPAPNWWQRLFIHALVPRTARRATLAQHVLHNGVMRELRAAQERGAVLVSEPPPELPVSRLTKDPVRVRDAILLGVEVGRELVKSIESTDRDEPGLTRASVQQQ